MKLEQWCRIIFHDALQLIKTLSKWLHFLATINIPALKTTNDLKRLHQRSNEKCYDFDECFTSFFCSIIRMEMCLHILFVGKEKIYTVWIWLNFHNNIFSASYKKCMSLPFSELHLILCTQQTCSATTPKPKSFLFFDSSVGWNDEIKGKKYFETERKIHKSYKYSKNPQTK